MNSRNKSLLLISVGPKTAHLSLAEAPSREGPPKASQAGPPPSKAEACAASPRKSERASSEQQRSKVGFPIRRFPDQSLFAAPRDLSQRTTSFIASQRQGIRQTPLRHLIALIAKARFLTFTGSPIGKSGRTLFGAKRPVLLQTHPGISGGQPLKDPRLVAR
jgi:hypothetical protein